MLALAPALWYDNFAAPLSIYTSGLVRCPPYSPDMIDNLFKELPPMLMPAGMPAFVPDEIDAYCVKCKTIHRMIGAQLVTTKNGKSAARGKCLLCHATMMKFLPDRPA